MKCPICKIELEFPIQELDEAYYDCSNCDSSLLFKNGECEILNEGHAKEPVSQKDLPEKNMLEQADLPQKNVSESPSLEESSLQSTLTEENTNQKSLEEEAKIFQENTLTEKNTSQTNLKKKTETFQEKDNQKILESVKETNLNEENPSPLHLEGENVEEEEFFPDETTQVPELNHSAEEFFDSSSEQEEEQKEDPFEEETQESSAGLEKEEKNPDNLTSEKDFPFEEGSEEPSSELQNAESQKEDNPQEKENFSEVAEFGNTQNQDKKGPFLYDLILSEINSQPVREQVLSTLDDEFLSLSLSKENIKDGKLTIFKISPVQAFIIVTALMGLPLHISWKQHHVAES